MMKTLSVLAIASIAISLMLIGTTDSFAKPESKNFVAPLSGNQEVPPVDTKATGLAKFQVNKDGDEISYKLLVNMDDVTQAHIHLGPEGENGPVVAFLFGFVAEGIDNKGILAQGTITEDNVIPRDGFDGTLNSLINEMRSGNTYVNVHSIGTPSGEIRGQIAEAGPSR
ncbi:MAG: CHRD domain-containing protein [Nitrosopumilus sp.]|nr:CHRD domain-containing protein [Nitrosopumilus sp.]